MQKGILYILFGILILLIFTGGFLFVRQNTRANQPPLKEKDIKISIPKEPPSETPEIAEPATEPEEKIKFITPTEYPTATL